VPTETQRVLQVALVWGNVLIDVQHFPEGAAVLAGDDQASHFHVFSPGLGSAFPLAQSHGSRITVNVPAGAGVVVASKNGDTQKTREQLLMEGKLKAAAGGLRAESVELGLSDRVQISVENVAFVVRFVRPSAATSLNTLQEHDFSFFKIVSICLMAFFALVTAMVLTPLAPGGEGDDIFANPSKYVKLVIKPEKQHELPKFKDLGTAKDQEKTKDRELRPEALKKPDPRKTARLDPNKRDQDRKKVNSLIAGMFGGGASSNLFGGGGLGMGINNALGGLQGSSGLGDSQGVGGLGSRGSGSGGGGSGLGLGGVGTKGGGGSAQKGGYGAIDLATKPKEGTRIIPGKTTVVGGLDKDVIMKVIKRHQNEIKFCYEQELQKNPSLAGKVAVAWTIDPAGGVSDANVSESSMGNANVEACIVQRIRRWKFPEPQGGGVVNVTFPWIFKAAGSEE
jgi:TonB family protein